MSVLNVRDQKKNILICSWCGNEEHADNVDRGLDGASHLYWCSVCERYNYICQNKMVCDNFKFILETKANQESTNYYQPMKLKKQISLLRYPGGKSRLIDFLAAQLNPYKLDTLVSTHFGGGHFELALLDAGVIGHLVINDLDFGIYSLFKVIKEQPEQLMKKILERTTPDREEYFKCQAHIKLGYKGLSELEAAWSLLVVNRLSRNGIFNSQPMKDILCRWNPRTLLKRIVMIHRMSDKITILNNDAVDVLEEYYWKSNTTIFIDPPYYRKGHMLYRYHYDIEAHLTLREVIGALVHDFPCADVIMTYDDCEEIRDIYSHPLNWYAEIIPIGRVYSIVN
jgi:DNA adenine methylase